MSLLNTPLLRLPPAIRTAVFQRVVISAPASIARRQQPHLIYRLPHPRAYSTTPISPETPPTTSEPQPKLPRRTLLTTALFLVFFTASFAMAAAPSTQAINGLTTPPTDTETLSLFDPPTPSAAEIDAHIRNHPLAIRLRSDPTQTESRAHLKIPPANRPHNLTAGVLMGENKLEVPPLAFNAKSETLPTMTQLFYLGPSLCGHPGIVHGGMLATMLDEGLARTCFPALPNKVGVTASLKIDYRKPCEAGRYVVFKGETTKVEGRKVWVKGWIEMLGEEDGDGVVVVEAEALFIEPKHAKHLPRSYVEAA